MLACDLRFLGKPVDYASCHFTYYNAWFPVRSRSKHPKACYRLAKVHMNNIHIAVYL